MLKQKSQQTAIDNTPKMISSPINNPAYCCRQSRTDISTLPSSMDSRIPEKIKNSWVKLEREREGRNSRNLFSLSGRRLCYLFKPSTGVNQMTRTSHNNNCFDSECELFVIAFCTVVDVEFAIEFQHSKVFFAIKSNQF